MHQRTRPIVNSLVNIVARLVTVATRFVTVPFAIDVLGRNPYVIFINTSDGQRPKFSRFNPDETFDPPLPVSTAGRI